MGLLDAAKRANWRGNYFAGRSLDARSSWMTPFTSWSLYRYFGSLGRRSSLLFQPSSLCSRYLSSLLRSASLPTLKDSARRTWVYHPCSSSVTFDAAR